MAIGKIYQIFGESSDTLNEPVVRRWPANNHLKKISIYSEEETEQ